MDVELGIDIAKEFHWAVAIDEQGTVLIDRRVDNDPVAIDALLTALAELARAAGGTVTAGVDVLGGIAGLLIAMLHEAGIRCVYVPGLAVNRARRATVGGENKSDPRDAKVIAEQVRTRGDLRPVELPDELEVEIRLMVGRRRDLVADQTRRASRLRDLLTGIHPGLERVIDPTHKASLALLSRYVTPAEIRRAGQRRIIDYLIRSGVRRDHAEPLAAAAVTAAAAQHITVPGQRRTAELVRELAGELLAGRARVQTLDHELAGLLERHPDAALIRSLPGMGATLTAEFLAEVGTISRFRSGDCLAAAAGLAPVLNQSGKTRNLRRPSGGNKNLKRVFYQSAFCAIQRDPASRAYYARKRAERKRHHQALIALARRRINVLHAILRTRQPYQPRGTQPA